MVELVAAGPARIFSLPPNLAEAFSLQMLLSEDLLAVEGDDSGTGVSLVVIHMDRMSLDEHLPRLLGDLNGLFRRFRVLFYFFSDLLGVEIFQRV